MEKYMAKSSNKLISYAYEDRDRSHLIEHEEKEEKKVEENENKSFISRTCPLVLLLKHSLCIQLSIVCVLFSLFVLFSIVKLTTNSSKSINHLIDNFNSVDDSNETDISDEIFRKTKLRHGSVRVITHCGTLFGGKEQEAFVFKVRQTFSYKIF